MKEIFNNVINSRDYKLEDILYKIDESYIKNRISKEEKEELEDKARDNANPQNSYAQNIELINELFKRIEKIESVVFPKEEIPNEEETIIDEYPLYVQPTGSHDAYKVGDKITFNGNKYTCLLDNCVWSPETYPSAWELVQEV